MKLRRDVPVAFLPPPEVTRHDTGLRFTDILFGFVIKELFVRLADWDRLPGFIRLQLICGAVLVLGSWIGFRRSLNRPSYEIKFFNLPFARFLLDQMMIILYFRFAVLTPVPPEETMPGSAVLTPAPYAEVLPGALVEQTAAILVLVVVLYAMWDVLGIWMAAAGGGERYPKIEGDKMTAEAMRKDFAALTITIACLAVVGVLCWAWGDADTAPQAQRFFVAATIVLLGYRWAKEIKVTVQAGRVT